MKISLNWLSKIIDISSIEHLDLVNQLTLAGFEIDNIEYLEPEKDIILNVSITANRGDAFSMLGFAREVAALYDLNYSPKLDIESLPLIKEKTLKFLSLENCLFYSFTILENIVVQPSPLWLQTYLRHIGFPVQNNIVDILNYILIVYGIPMSVYDQQKVLRLTNSSLNEYLQINVTQEDNQSQMLCRNLEKYELNNKTTLTKINEIPIGITGIIESQETLIDLATSSIILEVAIIHTKEIRQSSVNLNLKTEKSIRLEKGVDLELINPAYNQAIALIKELSQGKISKSNYFLSINPLPQIIPLNYKNIESTLGKSNQTSQLDKNQIEQILTKLGFILDQKDFGWLVTVPQHRLIDIEQEIDLIEEIGRIFGFDKFVKIIPEKNLFSLFSLRHNIIQDIKTFLLSNGFNELLHYSFQEFPDNVRVVNKIPLINPLTIDQEFLRDSILPNLLNSYIYNVTQGNGPLNAFEIGRTFSFDQISFIEEDFLASILGGDFIKLNWSSQTQCLTWFHAKGIVENLFQLLNIKVEWDQNANSNHFKKKLFHSQRWSTITANKEEIGIFGQIHPKMVKKLRLGHEIYVFELNLDKIIQISQKQKYSEHLFKTYSTFPSMYRDINVTIPYDLKVETIIQVIFETKNSLLQKVQLFDDYRDKSIPDVRQLSFRLFYQSLEENLKVEQIDILTENIKKKLQKYCSNMKVTDS